MAGSLIVAGATEGEATPSVDNIEKHARWDVGFGASTKSFLGDYNKFVASSLRYRGSPRSQEEAASTAHSRHSMPFTADRRQPDKSIASTWFAAESGSTIELSIIFVAFLTLAMTLGVRLRRRWQPLPIIASGQAHDIIRRPAAHDNDLELPSQGSTTSMQEQVLQGLVASVKSDTSCSQESNSRRGWGQPSSYISRPLTVCHATSSGSSPQVVSEVSIFENIPAVPPDGISSLPLGSREINKVNLDTGVSRTQGGTPLLPPTVPQAQLLVAGHGADTH